MTATATQEEEIKASDLTAEDVLDPAEHYNSHEIDRLLGIGQTFANALQRDDPKRYFPFTRGGTEVKGAYLLRWINGEKIPYQVTDAGLKVYRARQRIAAMAATPVAEPVPAEQSSVDKALQQVSDSRSTEEAEREIAMRHAESRYVTLVQRETLTDEETTEMAWVIRDLNFSDTQVREDRDEIIPRARRLVAEHEGREAAARRAVEARKKCVAIEKAHAKEERTLFMAKGRAEGEASQCHKAAFNLTMLAKRRPYLFEATDPPRLIEADVS